MRVRVRECVCVRCLCACLPACQSPCLSVCLPVCLPVCLSACLPACLSGWLAATVRRRGPRRRDMGVMDYRGGGSMIVLLIIL